MIDSVEELRETLIDIPSPVLQDAKTQRTLSRISEVLEKLRSLRARQRLQAPAAGAGAGAGAGTTAAGHRGTTKISIGNSDSSNSAELGTPPSHAFENTDMTWTADAAARSTSPRAYSRPSARRNISRAWSGPSRGYGPVRNGGRHTRPGSAIGGGLSVSHDSSSAPYSTKKKPGRGSRGVGSSSGGSSGGGGSLSARLNDEFLRKHKSPHSRPVIPSGRGAHGYFHVVGEHDDGAGYPLESPEFGSSSLPPPPSSSSSSSYPEKRPSFGGYHRRRRDVKVDYKAKQYPVEWTDPATGKSKYECGWCGKVFKYKGNMMRRKKCEQCVAESMPKAPITQMYGR
uniref:Uncharacterized protein n=1 Tax=Lotharella globosa TaxID=91324 RepID=A0A7S3Z061_9EUKA